MLGRPLGIIVLAAALVAAGFAGVVAMWSAWPSSSNTSPLAAMFAFVWSLTYLTAGLFTWRGSRLAAPAFLVALALLLPPFWFLFPTDRSVLLPLVALTALFGLLSYRYLGKTRAPAG